MKLKIFLFLVLVVTSLGAYSQIKLRGVIFDEESGYPVSGAFVMQEGGANDISDTTGQFSMTLEKLPAKLLISHVSYGQSEVKLEKVPDGLLVIRIQKMISQIEEVQVSAERMRILTEKDNFSLRDYAIDSTHIWMLGYLNNRPKNERLWIANLFGDTLRSISTHNAKELYRDVFGNVHLFYKDSVCQLFGSSDTIGLLDGWRIEEFKKVFFPIKAFFADKLIYQNFIPGQEGLHSYYYSVSDTIPRFLTCTRDTTNETIQEYEFVYGHAGSVIQTLMSLSESPTKRLEIWQAMVKRREKKHLLINRQVEAPLVATNDYLYIINLYKDSMLVFNIDGEFVDSRNIDFHTKLEVFKGKKYMNFSFQCDPVTNQVFLLERKETAWALSLFDMQNGEISKRIQLPDYPGMRRTTVISNAVYFLYPEKKYPYYVRLYRYQL